MDKKNKKKEWDKELKKMRKEKEEWDKYFKDMDEKIEKEKNEYEKEYGKVFVEDEFIKDPSIIYPSKKEGKINNKEKSFSFKEIKERKKISKMLNNRREKIITTQRLKPGLEHKYPKGGVRSVDPNDLILVPITDPYHLPTTISADTDGGKISDKIIRELKNKILKKESEKNNENS